MSASSHFSARRARAPLKIAELRVGPLVLVICFFLMSPLFALVGIKGTFFLVAAAALLFLNGRVLANGPQRAIYAAGFFYVLTSIALSIYWSTHIPALFAIFYVLTIVIVANTHRNEIDAIVDYASVAMIVITAAAWLGLFYFLMGGAPLGSIPNPDGRSNYFFLTTFSNMVDINYMRPGGIYDEPGALSFFICTVCTLREILGKNRTVTSLLVVAGIVTLSIAHLIYMIFHFATLLAHGNKKSLAALLASVVVGFLVLVSGQVQTIVRDVVIERALRYQSGELYNPREASMSNVYTNSTPRNLLLGFGSDCVARSPLCVALIGEYGENPLTPLVRGGILLAWPYYVVVGFLFVSGLSSRERLYLVGFALLLLQRPYVLEFPYSATIFLVVLALIYQREESPRLPTGTTQS